MIHTDGRPTIANAPRRDRSAPEGELHYRAARLIELGVPAEQAILVGSYEYGFVMELIEAGCDPELAVRIAG